MLQGMLHVAGSGGYYYKVLIGRFVADLRSLGLVFGYFVLGIPNPRSSGHVFRRFVLGAPDPRSRILVPGSSFLRPRFGRFVLGAPDPRSWSATARPTVVACIGHKSRIIAGKIF